MDYKTVYRVIILLALEMSESDCNRRTDDTINAPGFQYISEKGENNSDDFNSDNLIENRERRQVKGFLLPTAYTIKQQKAILDLHNYYRSLVDPPAANMRFMNWNDRAASYAQEWANTCHWGHGQPASAQGFSMGQNLYLGGDATGLVATELWFEERDFYDFNSNSCQPGEQCGHYTAIVWANSVSVGCGYTRCPNLKDRYYVVCQYTPPGNYIGQKPYEVGEACSQCNDVSPGFLCYNRSCITRFDCSAKKYPCACSLKCKNCGYFRAEDCSCACADGWDTADCSQPCMNTHEWCGVNPGFPNYEISCGQSTVRYTYCRKMCRMCRAVGDPVSAGRNPRICCAGRVCNPGYNLDKDCECRGLCPGPMCGSGSSGLSLLPSALIAIILVAVCSTRVLH